MSSCSPQQKNNQHSSVSLLISTLILRSNPTLIHLGRSNLKQLLFTCRKTSAAPKFTVIQPEELLINLQLLLDSNTPTYSLLSFILPPVSLIPWNLSILLSNKVMIPFFPSLLRIYLVTSCEFPLSSWKITETTPVLVSRVGFPTQQNFLKLSKLKIALFTIEIPPSFFRSSQLAISSE